MDVGTSRGCVNREGMRDVVVSLGVVVGRGCCNGDI